MKRPLCIFLAWLALGPGRGSAAPENAARDAGLGLTGDWGGRRGAWLDRGLSVEASLTSAVLANVSGGLRRGTVWEATFDGAAICDFEKFAGWPGLRARIRAVGASGSSITEGHVGDVRYISDFDLPDGLHLNEIWIERVWADGAWVIGAGKTSIDRAFPLYGAGDSVPLALYPVGALAAQAHWAPTDGWEIDLALYDGDPLSPGRKRERRGLNFRLARSEGATVAGTVTRRIDSPGGGEAKGEWKVGFYRTTRQVAHVATGAALTGSTTLLADVTQVVSRENPAAKGDTQGIDVYATVELAQPRRNAYAAAGIIGAACTGVLPGRDADILDVSVYRSRFSRAYSDAAVAAGGPAYGREDVVRVFYQMELGEVWTLQPQVDRVLRPGATGAVRPATVLSLRTTVRF